MKLRDAEPTLEEGRAFARYLDQAAEGFFRLFLGPRSVDILAQAFLQPAHDLSYENVTFATRDERIVGMVSCYTAEQHRRSSAAPLLAAAGRFNLRVLSLSVLLAPVFRVLDNMEPGDLYIQAIAIDPAYRGEGMGSQLLSWVEDHARAGGSERLALDVSAKNQGAKRLYERYGFSVRSRWPKRFAIPGLRLLRMKKEL